MEILPIVKIDPWLEPYAGSIYGRYEYFLQTEKKLTGGKQSLSDFATVFENGHPMLRLFF